jgi:D-alanyl-D-alanine carboxypeptidase/D-alanyl-D-alanine-endopeptidase (penicillin-binding protein 4)
VKKVGDVIGDDTLMPFERWVISERLRPGTHHHFGADAQRQRICHQRARRRPAGRQQAHPRLARSGAGIHAGEPDHHRPRHRAGRGACGHGAGRAAPASVRTLPAGGKAETLRFDVDDPADYAALPCPPPARGVKVEGKVLPRHAPLAETDIFATAPARLKRSRAGHAHPHDLAETLEASPPRSARTFTRICS